MVGQAAWSNIASFVIFAFLIRNLDVADIGLFALATSYVEILRVCAGAGLSEAVQREPEVDAETLDSAFWGSVGLALLVCGLMIVTAPLFASAMQEPRVIPLVRVLAVIMLISSLSKVHWALQLRQFGHRLLTVQTVAATVIGGAGAVVAVLNGAGVWALLVQGVVSEFIGLVLSWTNHRWRPTFKFRWSRFVELVRFGGGVVITHLLWAVLARIPDFFIGRTIGVAAVGTYRIAWRLIELIGQMFLQPLASLTFLSLAKLQNEPERFDSAYCRVLGLGSLFMIPAVAGFGLLAHEIIPLLFGANTASSIPIAQILAFSAPAFVANYFIASALSATGNSYAMGRIALVQLVGTLIVSIAAAPYGLVAITAAYVARGYLTLPYQQANLTRYTSVEAGHVWAAIRSPIFATLIMGAVLYFVSGSMSGIDNIYIRLTASVAVGAVAYFGALFAIDRKTIRSHLAFTSSLLHRGPANIAPESSQ